MKRKLIIDGNAVYELDEECMLQKKMGEKKEREEQGDIHKSNRQDKEAASER